jgi:hypothetical protein
MTSACCLHSSVIQDLHFAGLLDVQNIISADAGIYWQTEGHSLGDHLINRPVSVTPSSVIEASIVLCSVCKSRTLASIVLLSTVYTVLTWHLVFMSKYYMENLVASHIQLWYGRWYFLVRCCEFLDWQQFLILDYGSFALCTLTFEPQRAFSHYRKKLCYCVNINLWRLSSAL